MKIGRMFFMFIIILLNLLAMLYETSTIVQMQAELVILALIAAGVGIFANILYRSEDTYRMLVIYMSLSLAAFAWLYLAGAELGVVMIIGFSLNSFALIAVINQIVGQNESDEKMLSKFLKEEKEIEETTEALEKGQKILDKRESKPLHKGYVAGKNSKMYHTENCVVAHRIKNPRHYDSKEKAELAGYKPHDCVKEQ